MPVNTLRKHLGGLAFWTIALCAFLSTVLLVRREFFLETAAGTAPNISGLERKPVYVEGWQEAVASGIRMGSADAPIQIIEFADFQCPGCARYEATLRAVRGKYNGDRVALTFTHYPLSYHDSAEAAARAAECAHVQGRFEQMRSLLFEHQQQLGLVPWAKLAEEAGVADIGNFQSCLNGSESLQRVLQAKSIGEKIGIPSTPTIIVNGWMLPSLPSAENFDKIIDNVVDGRAPTTDALSLRDILGRQ